MRDNLTPEEERSRRQIRFYSGLNAVGRPIFLIILWPSTLPGLRQVRRSLAAFAAQDARWGGYQTILFAGLGVFFVSAMGISALERAIEPATVRNVLSAVTYTIGWIFVALISGAISDATGQLVERALRNRTNPVTEKPCPPVDSRDS